jgi:hypothetical protein
MSRGTLQDTTKISFLPLTKLILREFFRTIVLEIRQRLYMMTCFDTGAV